jgi:purine-binding chemotaxis protein CheW
LEALGNGYVNTLMSVLLIRVGEHLGALPLGEVIETMRPLPVERLAGAPPFVSGVAVVRGEPLTVVDLARMLDPAAHTAAGRFVTLRVGDRRVVLAVDEVRGVGSIAEAELRQMPPLLSQAAAGVVATLGALDRQLLLVLDCSRALRDSLAPVASGERAS